MMRKKIKWIGLVLALMTPGWLSAQVDGYLPPYFPSLNGTDEYATWYADYPDSLLRTQTPGEAVCTLHIDCKGEVDSVQTTASHPLFAQAAREAVGHMRNWHPALLDGHAVDTTTTVKIQFQPSQFEERTWRRQQVLEPCRGQDVDTKPVFPDEVRKLVMGNMAWPDDSVQKAVAVCRFTIDKEGNVSNARVLEGTNPAFDAEALRILSNFPRVVPAKRNDQAVAFDYFLTVSFWKLDYEYERRNRENTREELVRSKRDPYTHAQFPGGTIALNRMVDSRLHITPEIKESGRKGRVIYSFVVDKEGKMGQFRLVRSLCKEADAEALRVLQSVDKRWSRGYYYNSDKGYREFYDETFSVPVIFRW